MADRFKGYENEVEVLVQKAQKGDTEAFGKLYDFFVDAIYKYVYFKVDKNEAFDLTESIFLKVWDNLKSYKPGNASFSAWIFRVAHNMIVDHYRSNRVVSPLDINYGDDSKNNDPVYTTEHKLSSEILKEAIKKLKKKYQQIIILIYINELSNEEICKILKKSDGSVRILKFRALRALKKILLDMNVSY